LLLLAIAELRREALEQKMYLTVDVVTVRPPFTSNCVATRPPCRKCFRFYILKFSKHCKLKGIGSDFTPDFFAGDITASHVWSEEIWHENLA
jgi:hypothetical protein